MLLFMVLKFWLGEWENEYMTMVAKVLEDASYDYGYLYEETRHET